MATIADARQVMDAGRDECGRRPHVDDFGRARIADRPGAAHEQQRALVDAERGVVDAGVIVLRSVEDDRAAFERQRIGGVGQIARPELIRDDAELHDRRVEQVATQDR